MIIPTWCPGCGNFNIMIAIAKTLDELKLPKEEAIIAYGIGCHGNMGNWFDRTRAFLGLHGRAIPVACGIKSVRPEKTVICVTGDGDCFGEGLNHLIHAARRNDDIKVFVCNNGIYALTAGQASPTSSLGKRTKSTPKGVVANPLDAVALVKAAGAGFAEKAASDDIKEMSLIFKRALNHRGFSFVDIRQNCVSFNPLNERG